VFDTSTHQLGVFSASPTTCSASPSTMAPAIYSALPSTVAPVVYSASPSIMAPTAAGLTHSAVIGPGVAPHSRDTRPGTFTVPSHVPVNGTIIAPPLPFVHAPPLPMCRMPPPRPPPPPNPIHRPPPNPVHHQPPNPVHHPNLGRLPKLPFPSFDGGNPRRWCKRCEKYFSMYGTKRGMWISVAEMHFEGAASCWYQSIESTLDSVSWE
jgi:hypothetical protein